VEKVFNGCSARRIWRTPGAASPTSARKAKSQKRNC
jgi:hypothetical protein